MARSCSQPVAYASQPMTRHDKDTEYRVDDTPTGFSLSINYSRYQFIPESDATGLACKQALTALAYDLAAQRGRKIQRIEEQRIRVSFGRNDFSGITSCSATALVERQ